ncbi:MAG: serine/threonine-protein kinase [Burkholderiales bacterium]
MTIAPEALRRLSTLLGEALDLSVPERDAWLAGLAGDDAALVPTLRELLTRHDAGSTSALLGHPPPLAAHAAASADPGLAPGEVVGPYRLQRPIGRGGMGEVWLAERADGSLKRHVALKLPYVTWVPGLAERFARERDIVATLEHAGIARLYDAGVDRQGRPYLALEYVEGQPIDAFCNARALPVDARLRLLLQVADAVAFAHGRLVVHRDLKPGNILVTADGQVRLLDFGIAKLLEGDTARETALTRVAGRALTLDYASPEQIRGDPIGTASDVYSLGVVAFELLAGTRPYRLKRGSAAELEEAITNADAPLASAAASDPAAKRALRGDLDAILNKALKKDAAQRYPTVDALAQDWRRHLAGQAVTARPDTWFYRATRFAQRYRIPLAAAATAALAFGVALGLGATALVIVALLAGLAGALWQARRAREQARRAHAEGRKAEAVKRFLLDIFETSSHDQADPQKAQQTTARELLDIGVRRVDDALRDEPEPRIEVLGVLATLYGQIGLRTQAADLHRRATDLARNAFGARDLRFARVAIACAGALSHTARRGEVPALLAEANAALLASGAGETVDRALLLQQLCVHHRYASLGECVRTGEEAAALILRVGSGDEVANACRAAGRAQMTAGRYALAEAHYRRAIAVLPRHDQTGAGSDVNAHAELAEALFKQGRLAEAEAQLRTAVDGACRIHGAGHRWTMVVQLRLANLLVATGRTDEGLALRAEVEARLAEPRAEYDEQFRAELGGYLGVAPRLRGRPDLAMPLALLDVEDLRRYFAGSAALALGEIDLADMHVAYGRYDEAEALVRGARDVWERFSGTAAGPAVHAVFASVEAGVARARGDAAAAYAAASAVAPPDGAAAGRFVLRVLLLAAERARAEVACGRAEEGLARAEGELSALARDVGAPGLPGAEAQLLRARAEARDALGDLAAAAADWGACVRLRRAHDDEASLWLAGDLLGLGACLAALGRSDEARPLADEAARIFTVHPTPGPHLVAPLEALRRRIG